MAEQKGELGERRPWYAEYAWRPLLAAVAAFVVALALLLVGVALGGGRPEHVLPVGTFVVGLLAAVGTLGQLYVARQRHEEQTKADLQRRVTDSFAKAVEQIGSDKLQVRVGGIYTLERISRESPGDYWTVMETLTAFVRERARWKGVQRAADRATEQLTASIEMGDVDAAVVVEPPTDIAAVFTVIRRRDRVNQRREEQQQWRFDFTLADLRGAELSRIPSARAIFWRAHLEGASFAEADLEGAHFVEAHLYGAYLLGARLTGAHLCNASMRRALLAHANLNRADLHEADLEKANIFGARLEHAILGKARLVGTNLRQAHLIGALLGGANLRDACLVRARCEGATLQDANLENADFREAHFEGADLRHALFLTQEQLNSARGDGATLLPDCVAPPPHWPLGSRGAASS